MNNGSARIATAIVTYGFVGLMAFLSIFPFIWMLPAPPIRRSTSSRARCCRAALRRQHRAFFTQVNAPLVFWNSAKIAIRRRR